MLPPVSFFCLAAGQTVHFFILSVVAAHPWSVSTSSFPVPNFGANQILVLCVEPDAQLPSGCTQWLLRPIDPKVRVAFTAKFRLSPKFSVHIIEVVVGQAFISVGNEFIFFLLIDYLHCSVSSQSYLFLRECWSSEFYFCNYIYELDFCSTGVISGTFNKTKWAF